MKKNKFILLMNVALLFIAAQCISSPSEIYSSSGDIKQEERNVKTFKSIGLSLSATVIVKQGSPQKLVIEAGENDLEKIVTEVDGSNLKIKTKTGSWKIGNVTIYITMENIDALATSGSGSIKTDGKINCDNLSLAVSGSGSIEISDLSATKISSAISGSGKVNLSGSESEIESHKIAVSGSGHVYAEDLKTKDIDVGISGSGTCRVYATGVLKAGISGSGKVFYKGNPVVNAGVSGSGKVSSI